MIAQLSREYISESYFKTYQRLVAYFLFEGRPLTTKGRFINPFVFFLLSIFKRIPNPRKIEKPVFIAGTGRSGTTLLGMILSMHKDILFLNEPKAIWHSVNKNDDVIGSYQTQNARYRMKQEDANEKLRKEITRIYSCFNRLTFSRRIADKYPEMIFRIPYLLKLFPDAKIIFLQRNIIDTSLSTRQWNKDKQNVEESWWGWKGRKWKLMVDQLVPENNYLKNFTSDIDKIEDDFSKAAVEWLLTMQEGINQKKKFPGNILSVKYEDLLKDSELTIQSIREFCELPFDSRFKEYALKTIRKGKEKENQEKFSYPFIEEYAEKIMRELGYSSIQL